MMVRAKAAAELAGFVVIKAVMACTSQEYLVHKKVERVQNLQMWQSYAVKRNIIKNAKSMTNNQGDKVKTWLFHGTSIDTVPKIQTQGFNRAFAGKNAVACTYCPGSSASCFTCRT